MSDINRPWAPTPWRVGPVDDTMVFAADGSEVAAIDGDYNDPDLWPTMEANANLASAAPELFEELYLARDVIADERRVIFECHTVRNDPATLEDIAREDIQRLDAQLARIDAALLKALPSYQAPSDAE